MKIFEAIFIPKNFIMICSLFGTSKRFFDVLTKIRNFFMNLFEERVIIAETLSSFYLQYIEENRVEETKEMEK